MGQPKAVIKYKCLRHSFGILSSPQALLIFKECISICHNRVSPRDASKAWSLPVDQGFRHTGHEI
jgi:hypothetical protein